MTWASPSMFSTRLKRRRFSSSSGIFAYGETMESRISYSLWVPSRQGMHLPQDSEVMKAVK